MSTSLDLTLEGYDEARSDGTKDTKGEGVPCRTPTTQKKQEADDSMRTLRRAGDSAVASRRVRNGEHFGESVVASGAARDSGIRMETAKVVSVVCELFYVSVADFRNALQDFQADEQGRILGLLTTRLVVSD